jgi:hypothetical protein
LGNVQQNGGQGGGFLGGAGEGGGGGKGFASIFTARGGDGQSS